MLLGLCPMAKGWRIADARSGRFSSSRFDPELPSLRSCGASITIVAAQIATTKATTYPTGTSAMKKCRS